MYLSQLMLNPRSRQVRSELALPYELHRTVMGGFKAAFAQERVLYRLDLSSRDGIPRLLVQSRTAPDWSELCSKGGYLLDLAGGNPQVRLFEPTFSPGQRLAFRLVAAPTVSRKTEAVRAAQEEAGSRLRGKRIHLTRPEDQAAWLAARAARGGFQVEALRITNLGEQRVAVPDRQGQIQNASYWAVRFDGELRVTEPETFRQTLESGIGSAKGFGYGLLSVAALIL